VTDKVIVGLSGGVDSAVTALLLKREGFEVVGMFMKNWEEEGDERDCPAFQDFLDAMAVADALGIEFEAVNFAAEYRERVFRLFLDEYAAGRTPNPDVLCNSEIKFRAFLDHALSAGATYIATGHYAVLEKNRTVTMLKGADPNKDQSYFLHRLSQQQLAPSLFPIGAMHKPEVRELARAAGLPNFARKDSTGICFIGERPFREFLMRYLPAQPGPMETPEGRVIGEHQGLMYHTLGQRQGLCIGGPGEPWYVAAKNLAHNALIVVQGHDHPLLFCDTLNACQLSWIEGQPPDPARAYAAKTRYRQQDAACRIAALDDTRMTVKFDTPQWAVTPGQSVVLYDGEVCLGGGIIEAEPSAA
jgi:tRNA-specific 2-thiouridylase